MGLLSWLRGNKARTAQPQPMSIPHTVPTPALVDPNRKSQWCGKCHKGFYTEQAYLDHQCAARFHYKPTERMEAK